MKTKSTHPWFWPSPRYFAAGDAASGPVVLRYRNQKYCVNEVARCSSVYRAEKIAAALNRDEKRRAKKGELHA